MIKTIEKLIATAKAEIGYKEGNNNITKYSAFFDKEHPDFYNTKKQGAAWCDIFVDYCFVSTFGETQALDMLCQPKKSAGAGCKFSAGYFKKAGRFLDKPEAGDQIFFYDAKGEINHTGIVVDVDDKKVYTVEGNSDNCVKEHSYSLNNKKIAGYGRPRWCLEEFASNVEQPTQKPQNTTKLSEEEIALQVINGMWGNGKERQKRLTEAGYDYDAIQKIVNKKIGVSSKPALEKPKTFIGIVNTVRYPLNVRKGAGMQYDVVKTLPKGSKVELMEAAQGWYKLANGSGYVSSKYIIKA